MRRHLSGKKALTIATLCHILISKFQEFKTQKLCSKTVSKGWDSTTYRVMVRAIIVNKMKCFRVISCKREELLHS